MIDPHNDAAIWRKVAHAIAQELACYADTVDDPHGLADSLYLIYKAEAKNAVITSDHTIASFVTDDENSAANEQLQLVMGGELQTSQDWQDAVDQQDA